MSTRSNISLHQQCSTTSSRLKNEWISAAPARITSPHWMDGWMDKLHPSVSIDERWATGKWNLSD